MARGKHAVKAANRRAESAHEIIDRLTSELAEAKLRARQVETEAAKVPALSKRVVELQQERDGDELLNWAMNELNEWRRVQKADERRRKDALRQLGRLAADVGILIPGGGGEVDALEFIRRRYPAFLSALMAADLTDENTTHRWSRQRIHDDRLSDEALRRLQAVHGERLLAAWDKNVDLADVAIEALEAQQAGFTATEAAELILGDRAYGGAVSA